MALVLSLSDNSGGYVVYSDVSHEEVRVCADVAWKGEHVYVATIEWLCEEVPNAWFRVGSGDFTLQIWRQYMEKCKIYTNQKLEVHIMQKKLNTRQRRWLEWLKDYDHTILYHKGKANVIANAQSWRNQEMRCMLTSQKELRREFETLGIEVKRLSEPVKWWYVMKTWFSMVE